MSHPMDKPKHIALNVAVAGVIALLLIWGTTQYRQWSQFNKGDQALASGDYIGAIAGYEAAIHMYTPLSPLVGRAAEKLWLIAQTLEQRGDTAKALVAYRSLRSSFYAVRGLYEPGRAWIDKCDARIAALTGAPATLPHQPARP